MASHWPAVNALKFESSQFLLSIIKGRNDLILCDYEMLRFHGIY